MHQGHKTQIAKYGGLEGYRKEMRRRRTLRRNTSKLPKEKLKKLLIDKGMRQTDIAKKVGLSKTQVHRLVKKYGLSK